MLAQQITPNTPVILHFHKNLRQKMSSTKALSKKILPLSVNAKIWKNRSKIMKKNQDKDISKNQSNGLEEDKNASKLRHKHFTLPFPTSSSLLVSMMK